MPYTAKINKTDNVNNKIKNPLELRLDKQQTMAQHVEEKGLQHWKTSAEEAHIFETLWLGKLFLKHSQNQCKPILGMS